MAQCEARYDIKGIDKVSCAPLVIARHEKDKLAEQNEKMLDMLKQIVGTYDGGHYLEELTDRWQMDKARALITEIEEG
jgi:hypothetical protein